MFVEAPEKTATSGAVYPFADVQNLLLIGLREALEQNVNLRGEWEPLIDSLRIVSVLVSLEDLFDFPLPPEKLVRRGGYTSGDDAIDHISGQLQRLWDEKHKSGGRS
jgi:acyl carrier protein